MYPPAVSAIVTEPETQNPVVELPAFRGVSGLQSASSSGSGSTSQDLYFPKPFNDEQVRIVQLLEVSDGVVVQGPPGTGKTHTIANVICHYLAQGKRVLVTSMKDPALAVLQEQLPAEIRPLAISLLSSEQNGMKQFEHAIRKIASEVQGLDRVATAREIRHLESTIDELHRTLAVIDTRIAEWATKNLTMIRLGTDEIEPQEAARRVIDHREEFEWIPDALGIESEFEPRFSDADIARLRDARRVLGNDIDYLNTSIPQLVEFPLFEVILKVHRDLSQFERLRTEIEQGSVPSLADSNDETLKQAQEALDKISSLRTRREELSRSDRSWLGPMIGRLRRGGDDVTLGLLEALGSDLQKAVETRKAFLQRPVAAPEAVELETVVVEAVANLSQGKSTFGFKGLFGIAPRNQSWRESGYWVDRRAMRPPGDTWPTTLRCRIACASWSCAGMPSRERPILTSFKVGRPMPSRLRTILASTCA